MTTKRRRLLPVVGLLLNVRLGAAPSAAADSGAQQMLQEATAAIARNPNEEAAYARRGVAAPDMLAPVATVVATLKSLYGSRRFSTLDTAQNQLQGDGKWIPASLRDIKANFAAAGNGARGILVAEPKAGATVGHAFNLSYDGSLAFFDAEKKAGGIAFLNRLLAPGGAANVNTWFYRTAGPDMLP